MKRAEQVADGRKADRTYIGAMTARSGDIQAYRNPNGHGFRLEPDASGGQGRHHVHIFYDALLAAPALTKADKNELKLKLCEMFGQITHHNCPD